MEASAEYPNVTVGEGYAVGDLDALGEGPGFRKVRKGLGVTAFGVNAIVMPPGIESGFHYHDEQEELYFVHRGAIEIEFGDGTVQRLGEGGLARVDAATVRKVRNPGDVEAVTCRGRQGRLHRPRRPRARGRGADARESPPRRLRQAVSSARGAPSAATGARGAARQPPETDLRVNRALTIPRAEILLRASRSSGPGGSTPT